jgi:hypothetical protein
MPTTGRTFAAAMAALVCLFFLASCATRETTVVTLRSESFATNPWKGRSVDDVISAWGRPAQRDPDGQGGTILLYDKTQTTYKESSVDPAGPDRETPVKKILAKFWIGPDDLVYRTWFANEIYRQGRDAPPARPPTEDEAETDER